MRFTRADPREVDDEFQFHLSMRARELERQGLAPEQARERALAEFGDMDDARHYCQREDQDRMRNHRRVISFETFLQDLRYGFRSLRAARTATAIAMACIAIGVGANLAIFTVIHGVLLRPLPFADQQSLVRVGETYKGDGPYSVCPAVFIDLGTLHDTFKGLAAWRTIGGDLITPTIPRRVTGASATANIFHLLGTRPALGRTFDVADTMPGNPAVVVLSDRLWRSEFGADRSVIERSISIGGQSYRVIGVMPPSFDFPVRIDRSEFWVPLPWSAMGSLTNRFNHTIQVVGRLQAGTDVAGAQAQTASLAASLRQRYPNEQGSRGLWVDSIQDASIGSVRKSLALIVGAVGLVFLIACANVASVLLARGTARRREVSIRAALGATRGRLIRQLVTECALLAAGGAIVGIATARLAVSVLIGLVAGSLPRADEIAFDLPTVLLAIVASAAVVILVSLLPAIQATRLDLREGFGPGGKGGGQDRHQSLRYLIGAEAALALVLLVGAGLLIRSFAAVAAVDPGFQTENRLTFRVAPPALPDSERYDRFLAPMLTDIAQLPGVRSTGAVSLLPVQDGTTDRMFQIEGVPFDPDRSHTPDAQIRFVAGEYFRSMGIRLIAGRLFLPTDTRRAGAVAIVNEAFTKQYFDGRNPVGRRISIDGSGFAGSGQWTNFRTIVGVVASTRQDIEAPPMSEFYLPAAQTLVGTMSVVVATTADPYAVLPPVRHVMSRIAPEEALYRVGALDSVIPESLRARRLMLTLLAVFAGLAMVLSGAGIYGVTAYAVSRRTREIGIRMALGADRARVTRMIVRETLSVIGAGAAAGLAIAIPSSLVMRSLLFEVSPLDPVTLVAAVGVVLGAATLAALAPAIRASAVPPTRAIQVE
jgi:putative ABC transport system permease protein